MKRLILSLAQDQSHQRASLVFEDGARGDHLPAPANLLIPRPGEAAQRAGNQLDLAEATFTLGKLSALRGGKEEAERCLNDSVTLFERLGHSERAAEIRRHLASFSRRTEYNMRITK
jgi:hypothetical protein